MVESFADLPDGGRYNNAYTFITTLHPDEDQILHVREYVDTLHASQTLIPAVLSAARGSSAMGDLLGGVGISPMMSMAERVAVVTGAGRGIGKAIGLHLGALGYRVAVVGDRPIGARRTSPLFLISV